MKREEQEAGSERGDSWKRSGKGGWEDSDQAIAEAARQGRFPHALSGLALAKVLLLINLGDSHCFCSESNAFYNLINSQVQLGYPNSFIGGLLPCANGDSLPLGWKAGQLRG